MCGRYYIASEDATEEMRALIDEINRRLRDMENEQALKTGEIFPTDPAPVIALSRALARRAFLMRWGFTTGANGKGLIINARSETIWEKPLFRPLVEKGRCVVPATHYFEWEKRGKTRVKYAVRGDRGIIYMAGLYRHNPDTGRADFVIVTREAAQDTRFIHERMPVILNDEMMNEWLNRNGDPARVLAQTPPPLLPVISA